jgi:hypothetical protein
LIFVVAIVVSFLMVLISCDGISPLCPGNKRQVSGTECRPIAGLCDIAEVCISFARIDLKSN